MNEVLESVRNCPREALPQVIGEAIARLLAPPAPASATRQPDRLLSADEAAMRLGISKTTLYHKNFSFTVRDPQTRRLRFSERGIEEWIAKQTNNRK